MLTLGAVNPSHLPVRDHPLNRGRVLWLAPVAATLGGTRWADALRPSRKASILGSADYSWITSGRWPGSRHLYLSNLASGTSYARVPYDAQIDVGQMPAFTASCLHWIDQAQTDSQSLISQGHSTYQGWMLWFVPSPGYYAAYINAGVRVQASSPGTQRWVQATITWDGATAAIYLAHEGGFASASAAYGTVPAVAANDNLIVGKYYLNLNEAAGDTAKYRQVGPIRDVGLWRRALTATEVKQLWRESWAGYPSTLRREPSRATFALGTAAGRPWLYHHFRRRRVS